MTKKDYMNLARHISVIPTEPLNHRHYAVVAVALACRQDNPQFDVKRFVVACGLDPARVGGLT